jgi:hypothetical protein
MKTFQQKHLPNALVAFLKDGNSSESRQIIPEEKSDWLNF